MKLIPLFQNKTGLKAAKFGLLTKFELEIDENVLWFYLSRYQLS